MQYYIIIKKIAIEFYENICDNKQKLYKKKYKVNLNI